MTVCNSRTFEATCNQHGTPGYTNLRARLTPRGIELDPHVTGACVITLSMATGLELARQLTAWL